MTDKTLQDVAKTLEKKLSDFPTTLDQEFELTQRATKPVTSLSFADLIKEYQWVEWQLVTQEGEISEELERYYDEINRSIAQKVDSIDWVIDSLESKEKLLEEKIQKFKSIKDRMTASRERLRGLIKAHLVSSNKQEIEGVSVRYKLSHARPVVVIEDEKEVPLQFVSFQIKKHIDKEAIREAAKESDTPIPGIKFEPTYRMTRSSKL